jgi:hypothetical protein
MDNSRTDTARRTDDKDLIENMEEGASFSGASGGELQRDIGSRAEMQHGDVGEPGVTRVQDKEKRDANLPRFNQK